MDSSLITIEKQVQRDKLGTKTGFTPPIQGLNRRRETGFLPEVYLSVPVSLCSLPMVMS